MIGRIWEPLLAQSLGPGRDEGRRAALGEVEYWCAKRHRNGADILAEFHSLGAHEVRDLLRAPATRALGKRSSEYRLLQDALEQVELADRLGFDVVWEVEHHFLEEYSHSSAPEVFLGACSQRTKDIRLGHGIIQTAPGYNHPARTAERVATLDLISGGRVEFGSGESGSEAELGGFLVDPATKRDAWLEGLEVVLRCMTETPFTGVDGRFRADAAAQRRPQADAAAAPSAVGGLLPTRHHPAGGREGHRRAHFRLHRSRGGDQVGVGLRADTRRALRPRRARRQPQHRLRHPDDVPPR
jgi:alkanesulfonate monooxygenase SsuD/methylene tetrahydromethanopterin reductase-like flavin-dependent oxidoreductase (luciferase family)